MKESYLEREKRTQRDYTLGFKLAVVRQVEKGGFTYKQAQKHYGIQVRLGTQWGYLSLITDAYSRKIMGYCFREDLSADGCIEALNMAVNNRLYNESIIQSTLGFDQTKIKITNSIKTYNELRPHTSCDYLTPNAAHLQSEKLKKRWKTIIEVLIIKTPLYSKFRIKINWCVTITGFI